MDEDNSESLVRLLSPSFEHVEDDVEVDIVDVEEAFEELLSSGEFISSSVEC